MPTYVVTATPRRLSKEHKVNIAKEITEIHCSVTGAPRYFVQILFNDVLAENYFLAGKHLEEDNIYVHAHIREGRTTESKQKIMNDIIHSITQETGADKSSLQVYITDIPASQVAEFGSVLPEPGQEQAWENAQSTQAKERMARLNAT
ncbi:tautomerase family protein, partial [Burkholderiales bacterium]|nr:tautomerase family protein [Burkholderiales bacterium]